MSFSAKNKKFLWKRDGGKCFYCQCQLTWKEKTIDHVIPKSKGGPHRLWNLVISCLACNQAKGDSEPSSEQLDVVLRRKVLHETIVSVGQAIELAKKQRNSQEVAQLLEMLWSIQDAIEKGSVTPPTNVLALAS